MKNNEKGFLGPIGDDLPSLIPLLFGLMIFFGTYSFALSEFTLENQEINNKLEVFQVSRVLRTDGLVDSFEDFNRLCDSIPLTSVKFKAGLINVSENQGLSVASRDDFIEDVEGGFIYCLSPNTEFEDLEETEARRQYSLIYPVALQQKKVVLPVHLVVTAWRE